MNIIIAIFIFSAIILFHELGHFLLAKMNGIVVNEFSLGMGPRILSFEKGGTRYSWKLLPLGGSCAMKGEDDEDHSEGSFNSKSVGARISVVAAGPIFNFFLALFVAIIIISVVGYDPADVVQVADGSSAQEAGLEAGDLITSFQGEHVDISRDISIVRNLEGIDAGEPITMTYERDGESHDISFMPDVIERYMLGFTGAKVGNRIEVKSMVENYPMSKSRVREGDSITGINGYKFQSYEDWQTYIQENPLTDEEIQITFERDGLEYEETMTPEKSTAVSLGFAYNTARQKTTPMGVLKYSFIELKYWIKTTLKSLGMLITGRFGIDDLSGPVGVVDVIGDTYNQVKSQGPLMIWMNMLNMVILLSANLGVMNLLPLPALDGGRLVFLIFELIRGKAVDQEKEAMVHFVGIMLLMVLMIVVMFNDIQRLF